MRPAAHKAGKSRANPLTSAAEFGRDDILELLLENYNNLRNYSNDIAQALIVATKAGYHSTMKLLLQHYTTVEDARTLTKLCAVLCCTEERQKDDLTAARGQGRDSQGKEFRVSGRFRVKRSRRSSKISAGSWGKTS